jgi:hypothetical protein
MARSIFCDLRYGDQMQMSQITNNCFVFVNHKHKSRYETAPLEHTHIHLCLRLTNKNHKKTINP